MRVGYIYWTRKKRYGIRVSAKAIEQGVFRERHKTGAWQFRLDVVEDLAEEFPNLLKPRTPSKGGKYDALLAEHGLTAKFDMKKRVWKVKRGHRIIGYFTNDNANGAKVWMGSKSTLEKGPEYNFTFLSFYAIESMDEIITILTGRVDENGSL
jgi:hypothetical protein